MKKKSKLALDSLFHELKLMDEKQIKNTLGGNGVVSGGAGTINDPYVIVSTFYYLQGIDANTVSNITTAASQFSSSGVVLEGGKYFRFEVNAVAISEQDYNNWSTFQQSNSIRTTSSNEKQSWANLFKISSATTLNSNGDYTLGDAGPDVINLFEGSVSQVYNSLSSNGATYTSNEMTQNVLLHEMLHTLGLGHDDSTGNVMNTNIGNNIFNVTSSDLQKIIRNIGFGESNMGNNFSGRVLTIDPLNLSSN